MKKIVLILISLLPIYIFSILLYFIDEQSNTVDYVIVSQNDKSIQLLTPIEMNEYDTINISSMGFRDTIIIVPENDITVMLRRENIIKDTIYIKGEKPYSIKDNEEFSPQRVNNLKMLSPFVQIKTFGRSMSISIRNSTAEQVTMSINNIPIINPSTGLADIDLMPILPFETISITKDSIVSLKGTSVFTGNIGLMNENKKGIKALFSYSDKKDIYGGICINQNGAFFDYEREKLNNLNLCSGAFLENSYRDFNTYNIGYRNHIYGTSIIYSQSKFGDPGISGSYFKNAYIERELIHYQSTFKTGIYELNVFLTDNYFHYYNNELSGIIDDESKTINTGININRKLLKGKINVSYLYDMVNGSKTGINYRNNAVINYSIKAGNFDYHLSIAYPKGFGFLFAGNIIKDKYYARYGLRISGRQPTFNELYWQGDLFACGNSELTDERSVSIFYNLHRGIGKWGFALNTGLDMHYDLIVWQQQNSIYMPVNKRRVFNPYMLMHCSYTVNFVKLIGYVNIAPSINDKIEDYSLFIDDLLNGNTGYITDYYSILPYRPIINSALKVESSYKNIGFYISILYQSKRFINEYNTKFLNAYYFVNEAGIVYRKGKIETELKCLNLLNTEYEDIRGYKTEGRRIILNLKLEV